MEMGCEQELHGRRHGRRRMLPADHPFLASHHVFRYSNMIEDVSTDRLRCARKPCEFPTGNMLLETRLGCITQEHRMGGTAWVGEFRMIDVLSG